MKVLLVAIFLVALVVLASAGWDCTEEKVKKICGPDGEELKKKMMEKMGSDCVSKFSQFKGQCEKICTDYKDTHKDWNKVCEAKKELMGEMMKVDGAQECFAKLKKQ